MHIEIAQHKMVIVMDKKKLPYFPTDKAHPKLFYIPFEVQIKRT